MTVSISAKYFHSYHHIHTYIYIFVYQFYKFIHQPKCKCITFYMDLYFYIKCTCFHCEQLQGSICYSIGCISSDCCFASGRHQFLNFITIQYITSDVNNYCIRDVLQNLSHFLNIYRNLAITRADGVFPFYNIRTSVILYFVLKFLLLTLTTHSQVTASTVSIHISFKLVWVGLVCVETSMLQTMHKAQLTT